MDEMKSKIQSSKNQIQQLETLYADILSQVDILEEFEQRIAAQETRYAEMLTSLPSLLDAIHQQALQLAQVKIQELTEAEEQAFADKLAEMNDQLTIMQNWFAKYQELQDQTDDLLGRFESVSNDANDLQTVIDEVNDAYTHYSDAEQILDRLDALDDIDDWEAIYDDLNGQLEDAYNEFSSATNGLDFFLESAVEPIHAEAESYYNDLEAAMDDCQSILDDMHSRFDDIPFPN
jgi:chromosome segregation ATPase